MVARVVETVAIDDVAPPSGAVAIATFLSDCPVRFLEFPAAMGERVTSRKPEYDTRKWT